MDCLDRLEPGAALAARLTAVDTSTLSAADRVKFMVACQKLVAHFQAKAYEQMAAITSFFLSEGDDSELAYDSAAAEIAAALHLTRRAADHEIDMAWTFVDRLPAVGGALAAGRIDLRRARTFSYGTCHLDDDVAREVVGSLLERATRMTSGQLEAHLRRQCIKIDPEAAKKRLEKANAERRVVLEANATGTAGIFGLDLSPEMAAEAMARICALAERAKTARDSRTIDQVKADVYLDLLLGAGQSLPRGVVNVTVDLETLTRLAENPGELAGYGPVVSDIARQVAEQRTNGEWRYTICDPETDQALANGITRRRPTIAQRRRVEALNPTCIHPGCRAPAIGSDLDHRIEYAKGGPTRTRNLVPFCRYHHGIRHRANWTHRPLPNGDHLFISRLGHEYTTSGRSP